MTVLDILYLQLYILSLLQTLSTLHSAARFIYKKKGKNKTKEKTTTTKKILAFGAVPRSQEKLTENCRLAVFLLPCLLIRLPHYWHSILEKLAHLKLINLQWTRCHYHHKFIVSRKMNLWRVEWCGPVLKVHYIGKLPYVTRYNAIKNILKDYFFN